MGFREMAIVVEATPKTLKGTPYFLLLMMANKTTKLGYVFASVDELADDMHVSHSTAQRTAQKLLDLGQLEECDWDDLPDHLPKPRADRRPRLYRIVVLRGDDGQERGSNSTPRDGGPRGSKSRPRGSKSPPRGSTAVLPDRESEREPDRDPEAHTREEPDPDGEPVPISQIAATVREALRPKAGPADGE